MNESRLPLPDAALVPGSEPAIAAGCKCPVLDNGHGRGYLGQPGVYVYAEGCPLHWPAREALGA